MVQGFEQIGSTLFTSHFRIGKYDEDFICREFISFEENWREPEVTRAVDNKLIGLSISYRGNRNIIVMELDTSDLSSPCSLQDTIPQYAEQNFHPILSSGVISRPILMCESQYGSIYSEDVTNQIENHDSCSAENFYNTVREVNVSKKLNIFPNPASDILTVLNDGKQEITVYNLMGKREAVKVDDSQIDVS
ncbi:MAG: T9SS type A sorting domain-containing protein, partial [Flavobacteriales bacterium]|nr:T9SS type A sorting domain-containing protein [Flavobacteriales bacterium]